MLPWILCKAHGMRTERMRRFSGRKGGDRMRPVLVEGSVQARGIPATRRESREGGGEWSMSGSQATDEHVITAPGGTS